MHIWNRIITPFNTDSEMRENELRKMKEDLPILGRGVDNEWVLVFTLTMCLLNCVWVGDFIYCLAFIL